MPVRILSIGEIVGKPGVFCVKNLLPGLKQERNIDFVIANGEGATGGFGIGKNHAIYLHKLGIDVITVGEKGYYKLDMVPFIQKCPFILRPANYPYGNPGRGYRIYPVGENRVAVISLLGQSGFTRVHLSNPFTHLQDLAAKLRQETPIVILEFHATTTAEKYTMFHYADGTVSAVIGTHTKVLTADERILPRGTGIICDTGRTGSQNSVGGLDIEIEIRKNTSQIPERSSDAWDRLELQGVLLEIDETTGKTLSIERIAVPCKEAPPYERESHDPEG